MHCPRLSELPAPPPDKIGWPWTEESSRLQATTRGQPWPRISVVTPSFNQGQFLEETIRSILLQGYPNLEYLVLDAGSKDGSVEIIKKYSPWISYWVSQRDEGQSAAINQGLKQASGEFATWINSDDMLCRNALLGQAGVGFEPNTVYVGWCTYIDRHTRRISMHRGRVHSLDDLVSIKSVWRSKQNRGNIDQPAVLFPRKLALSVGPLNPDNHHTMDYELWGEFFYAGTKFQYTDVPFGMFRQHPEQKTYNTLKITESLLETAARLVRRSSFFPEEKKSTILAELQAYKEEYAKDYWRGTGRLAKMGLPSLIVTPLRRVRAAFQKNF